MDTAMLHLDPPPGLRCLLSLLAGILATDGSQPSPLWEVRTALTEGSCPTPDDASWGRSAVCLPCLVYMGVHRLGPLPQFRATEGPPGSRASCGMGWGLCGNRTTAQPSHLSNPTIFTPLLLLFQEFDPARLLLTNLHLSACYSGSPT